METTTISLRLSFSLVERIDADAAQAGMNRTAYIMSWLPESYDSATEPSETARVAAVR